MWDKLTSVQKKRMQIILSSAFVFGVIAHGTMLFNKFSYFDDAEAFNGVGQTINLGRWALYILKQAMMGVFGTKHISLPLFNGGLLILMIAGMYLLIADYLDIRSAGLNILTTGFLISFPAVTGIFGFMFTASYYFLGMFLGVLGAYIYARKKNWKTALVCIALMAFSTGIYQANIPVSLCALLLFLLKDTYESELSWKDYIKLVLAEIGICVGHLVLYLAVNSVFLSMFHMKMSPYKGTDTLGVTNIPGYLSRILSAYREFLFPVSGADRTMYPYSAKYVHILLCAVMIGFCLYSFAKHFRSRPVQTIQAVLIFLVYPLAAYFIFVMVEAKEVYTVMVFGEAFLFILFTWIMEQFPEKHKVLKMAKQGILCLAGLLLFLNIRLSNISYLRAEILQSQLISYNTALISRIQSAEGYDDKLPVVYIHPLQKSTDIVSATGYLFGPSDIVPFHFSSLINNYTWEKTMRMWCGFDPETGNAEDYINRKEVAEMPVYPDEGSIRVIDGAVVVKFAD